MPLIPNPGALIKRVDGVLETVDATLGRVDGTLSDEIHQAVRRP
jgi:hypothetical protein